MTNRFTKVRVLNRQNTGEIFSIFRKSFAFLLLGCLWTFYAAKISAQTIQPKQNTSVESSEILKSVTETEAQTNLEKPRIAEQMNAPHYVQKIETQEKIVSEDKSDAEKENFAPVNINRRREINEFQYNFSLTGKRKKPFVFTQAAIVGGKRFSFRASPAASPDDEKNSALPDDAANTQNGKADGFHWRAAIGQSLIFLAVQHGYAFTQPKTREALKGKFWKDYVQSVKSLRGWDDGGRFFTNYIAHPMQGSFTGFIYVQNDPKGIKQQFGAGGDYWRSRLKAMAWTAAWSTQFEIGPISQASIGNVGLKGKQTWGDIVVTPTVGTALLVSEDAIDRFLMKRIERATDNFYTVIFSRMLLNPTRTIANLFRFKTPWYRDRPREH